MSVVEHAYLAIIAGREAEFESAFLAARPVLTGATGCRGAELFRDAEEPGTYLLRVHWQTLEDHVDVFPSSAAGAEFAGRVAHFFGSPPTVRHFDAVPVDGRGGEPSGRASGGGPVGDGGVGAEA